MTTVFIFQDGLFKFLYHFIALCLNAFHSRFLLGNYCCDVGIAKTQFGFESKQALGTVYQAVLGFHTHVSKFDILQDIIFGRRIVQLNLVVEIKS